MPECRYLRTKRHPGNAAEKSQRYGGEPAICTPMIDGQQDLTATNHRGPNVMNVLEAGGRKATDFFSRFFREMVKKLFEGPLQTRWGGRGFAGRGKGSAFA
jgi:predicted Fe-Mo cluster-binding NifX family protein